MFNKMALREPPLDERRNDPEIRDVHTHIQRRIGRNAGHRQKHT
jgi:hypothetical protein